MIILQNAVQSILPEVAGHIHYEALFELTTIEPVLWIKLYHKLGDEIAGLVISPESEIYELFASRGIKTQKAQVIFIISELKRHLSWIMQLSPY